MREYNGLIYAVNIPPMFLRNGIEVVIGNKIKTISQITDAGSNHLLCTYHMENDDKSYSYNDLRILIVEPRFNIGSDIQPWFENSIIHISQDTQTNWGYSFKVDGGYKYTSKSSIRMYLLPEFWEEVLKFIDTADKIKFRVYKNKTDQNIPEFWNSNSVGYHAKLI